MHDALRLIFTQHNLCCQACQLCLLSLQPFSNQEVSLEMRYKYLPGTRDCFHDRAQIQSSLTCLVENTSR